MKIWRKGKILCWSCSALRLVSRLHADMRLKYVWRKVRSWLRFLSYMGMNTLSQEIKFFQIFCSMYYPSSHAYICSLTHNWCSQGKDAPGGLFFYTGHLERESLTWPKLLLLKQIRLFSGKQALSCFYVRFELYGISIMCKWIKNSMQL